MVDPRLKLLYRILLDGGKVVGYRVNGAAIKVEVNTNPNFDQHELYRRYQVHFPQVTLALYHNLTNMYRDPITNTMWCPSASRISTLDC